MEADLTLPPIAELTLAWAAEAVVKGLPQDEAVALVMGRSRGDAEAVSIARQFAEGSIDRTSERARQVDEMLFGPESRLDDPTGGRASVASLLAIVESRLRGNTSR